jgi:isoleucyl-tRNA synthetase
MAKSTKSKKSKKSKKPAARPAKAPRAKAKRKLAVKTKASPAKGAKPNAKSKTKPKPKSKTKPKPKTKSQPKRKTAAKPKTPTRSKAKAKPKKAGGKSEPSAARPRVEPQTGRDWSKTLFLPSTDFPMKAGLPQKEPELLKRWERLGLYHRLREDAKGREAFVLHDGPPYANAHIHAGTGLNKILKDVVVRSRQMTGKDANYVPGWDCHGLPIEWKVEEENYRARGQAKPDLSDADAMIAFRAECRSYAEHWLNVQREEFKRLGVVGDWEHPYTTMNFDAEATIATELMKFAMNGLLYRGSRPVMWSVVERTTLAEAEVEYEEIESPSIYVKFPVLTYSGPETVIGPNDDEFLLPEEIKKASIVIWTTTPWTIPGNRAVSFSKDIDYGVYEVTQAPDDNWAKVGDRLILADSLAEEVLAAARVGAFRRFGHMPQAALECLTLAHPLRGKGYEFDVPLLAGAHVTEDTGTGFVHTAPGHGAEDFEVWEEHRGALEGRGIDTKIPFTVDEAGFFTKEAPGFEGKRVIDQKGKFGDANPAVIAALTEAGALIARARRKHDYPHSWRSKKPVIFRATPQWFIAVDKPASLSIPSSSEASTLRARALKAVGDTQWVPPQGKARITGMIETRPDWVVSRQRAWGVPITVFRHKETGEVVPRAGFENSDKLIERVFSSFRAEGADAWFKRGAKERYLTGVVPNPADWEKVDDILDVWFDSGATHAFVLEKRIDLEWPAALYLEGSDQHRGWFQHSLLESCGTRGRAPYDAVVTHGFVVDEDGRKMSKSLGNVVAPQDVIRQSGAEILRLWAMSSDCSEDLRIGPDILKANVDSYRKLRNTLRFLLGNLVHYRPELAVDREDMPELERYMLARLAEMDGVVRAGYQAYDFKRAFHALLNFCVNDLSAFYFDIRKDALYCDPSDSVTRRAALTVLDRLFETLTVWLAPMLCFTMEEAWLNRFPSDAGSVHLRQFPDISNAWRDEAITSKWRRLRELRRVVTGALELERKEGRIGSSLEAAPKVYVADSDLRAALQGIDLAEIAITSGAELLPGEGPSQAFRLDDLQGVAVVFERAKGTKCARSWKILEEVGSDPEFPELSLRDAEAVRQFDANHSSVE